MANGTRDFTGTLDIHDFRMVVSGVTLNDDSSIATIAYKGIASPSATCSLATYQYSADNGTTWTTMTTSSATTGLSFVASPGYSGTLLWQVKTDLGTLRYNTTLRIRFRANDGSLTTNYAMYSFTIVRIQTDLSATRNRPAFPNDYAGIAGGDLMKNAPKY